MKTEEMPTTSEFKFNCPECNQHIQVAREWSGRQTNCPVCNKTITIPAPPKAPEKTAPVGVLPNPVLPKLPTGLTSLAMPKEVEPRPAAPAPAQATASTAAPEQKAVATESAAAAKPATAKLAEPLHVAILTPAVKLHMVRAVRQRIANESAWIPPRIDGATAYAAKVSDGKNIPVDFKSPEATRFSLIGAFLLELHLKHVVQTATGRTNFLDHEIPDAIREVLLEGMSDEEREHAEHSIASTDVLSVSHAQCLAALDVLEDQYSQRMEQIRVEKARRRLGNVRLADLVTKLEKKARVAPEDVATALYHELMDVRRRLDRLESRIAESRKPS